MLCTEATGRPILTLRRHDFANYWNLISNWCQKMRNQFKLTMLASIYLYESSGGRYQPKLLKIWCEIGIMQPVEPVPQEPKIGMNVNANILRHTPTSLYYLLSHLKVLYIFTWISGFEPKYIFVYCQFDLVLLSEIKKTRYHATRRTSPQDPKIGIQLNANILRHTPTSLYYPLSQQKLFN